MYGTVGIIGCGWLGKALAHNLLENSHKVKATSSQIENVTQLISLGIDAARMKLPSNETPEVLANHPVFSMSHLVIAIPPRLKRGQNDYPEKIAQIVNAAELSCVKHIILLSSTAVYNGILGPVQESNTLNLTAEKVAIIDQAEKAVLKFSRQANIVRLAGLIGPDRHPGKFLSGKTQLPNPEGAVNLIHQQDAVGIILAILKRFEKGSLDKAIFNAASDTHDSRESFYTLSTLSANLPLPQFIKINPLNKMTESKIIMNNKVKVELAYEFIHHDLIAWLKANKK